MEPIDSMASAGIFAAITDVLTSLAYENYKKAVLAQKLSLAEGIAVYVDIMCLLLMTLAPPILAYGCTKWSGISNSPAIITSGIKLMVSTIVRFLAASKEHKGSRASTHNKTQDMRRMEEH